MQRKELCYPVASPRKMANLQNAAQKGGGSPKG